MIWLIFLALAIFSVCIIQLQEGRSKRLQEDCRQLQKNLQLWQDKLRKKESSIDHLQRDFAQLLKWKERASELEEELKRVKQTQDYASAQRLQFLEDYIANISKKSARSFPGHLPFPGTACIRGRTAPHAGGCQIRDSNSVTLDKKADLEQDERATTKVLPRGRKAEGIHARKRVGLLFGPE